MISQNTFERRKYLETYFVEISNNYYQHLQKNIWTDRHFQGNLTINEQKYKIQFGLRGNQLRKHKKKSYHVIFENPHLFNGQHELHLNAEYKDPSLMRNKLSFDFFQSIGVVAPNAYHILLSINGNEEQIYLCIESFDQYYLKNHNLPDGSIYYATNDDANFSLVTPEGYTKKSLLDGYTIKHAFQKDESLKKLLIAINTYSKEKFNNEIEDFLDIEKYFKWLAGVVCTQNFDGFIHNYALYENSLTQRFEISPWDYDGTWGRNLHGKSMEYNVVPITGFNTLTARLLDCEKFRHMYKDILKNILENQFTPSNIQPKIEQIQSALLPYIKENRTKFLNEKQHILSFIEKRRQYLFEQLHLCL